MTNSEIHIALARQVERRHQIWAMRQWYLDLLRRKARENAQQELFAEEARSGCKAIAYVVLLVLAAAVAGLIWWWAK